MMKTKKVFEFLKVESDEPRTMCGDVFHVNHELYMLSAVGGSPAVRSGAGSLDLCLISLANGNRWTEPAVFTCKFADKSFPLEEVVRRIGVPEMKIVKNIKITLEH